MLYRRIANRYVFYRCGCFVKRRGKFYMIEKVGNDAFGKFLIETLKQYKVDTSMVKKDEKLPTTIAFVSRDANGERDFQFNRGADQNLEQQDLSLNKIWKSSIFHF